MRDAARLFLDRRMTRRGFVSRLTRAGVAASAAASLSTSLDAQQMPSAPGAQAGRVLHDATGGEVMAEFLIDWNVPYVFGLAGSEALPVAEIHGLAEKIGAVLVDLVMPPATVIAIDRHREEERIAIVVGMMVVQVRPLLTQPPQIVLVKTVLR